MSLENTMSLIDVAGSQKRWDAYVRSVKNVLPKHQRNESQRYFSMYSQMAQDFLKDPNVSNKASILTCMFNAPKLGLNPDKVFGHIYFIPYKGVLTYQIGYKGMIQLSLNSGKIRQVYADLVYEKDEWDFYRDEKGQHYIHRPALSEKVRGKEICGYSVFEDTSGTPHIHVMDSYHIDEIKKMVAARMGKNFQYCPWGNPLFEPEMRKKTVIRRHWKTEPMSAEVIEAMETEENVERGIVPSKEEIENVLEHMIEETQTDSNPDPNSEEGKRLGKELDMQAAQQSGQSELPFK